MSKVIPESLDELSKLETALVCTGIGCIGGILSYALKVQEGKPWRWGEFALHCSISAFSGFIMFEFADMAGLSAGVAGAACGVAGWMGTRLIRIIEVVIRNKLGVQKDDLKQMDD